MKNLLMTGANGFVGRALCLKAKIKGHRVIASTRGDHDLSKPCDWTDYLTGINTVIHLAARVHVMHEKSVDPLAEFLKINGDATLDLAKQAVKMGVKRFIYVSSVKVNGEETIGNQLFTENDLPNPQDPYGVSKYKAEERLRELALQTGLELVIVRPPLIYGPGVKGNFQLLIRCLFLRIPLPLGAIGYNRRSLIGLDNLVDFLLLCVDNQRAAHQTFLISDGEDLSTTDLLIRTGKALGKNACLFPVSCKLLKKVAKLTGKTEMAQKLLGSLQVDISKAKKILNWSPLMTVDQGLERAVQK